jgi:hypothetical protein
MTNVIIKKDQIARLKALADYMKKMESFSPLNNRQIFSLVNDKLTIYGTGNAGHIEATIDVDSKDSLDFQFELPKFITFLDKMKSEEIHVSIANDKMTIKSPTNKLEMSHAVLSGLTAVTVKEAQTYVKTTLALPEFNDPIEVKLGDNRDVVTDICGLTNIQDTNRQISLSKDTIKAADHICIVRTKVTTAMSSEEVYIDRDLVSLFKGTESFKISSDKKYYYFDIQNFGIKLIFTPKAHQWQYPTDADLTAIRPLDNKLITITVNTENFYKLLEDFDNVFDRSTRKYDEVYFRTPKEFAKSNEIEIHYSDDVSEVRNKLAVEITANTDNTDDFSFLMPTLHFDLLDSTLSKHETFKIKYSSTKISEPNGQAIIIENPETEIILAKMHPKV